MLWIIALVVLALVGAAGYYQGPIRAAASLFGILLGALLAKALASVFAPLLPKIGLPHPFWKPVLPPLIAFLVILIIFKIIGTTVHRKVKVSIKYDPDDKRFYRWQRMYSRLGLCVGLMNGAVYFYLLLIPIYCAGYLTAQVASDGDTGSVQWINKIRGEMHDAKLDRVVAAYDPMPKEYYVTSDILGLVKHNPLLESRLAHYPVFLSLAERKEFQDLATDEQLHQMILSQAKIGDILKHPSVQMIVTNAETTTEISKLIGADLNDLHEYLQTGKSPKYESQKILGIWTVDPQATVAQQKKKHPTMSPLQLKQFRNAIYPIISGMTLTATIDQKAILKKEKANEPATRLAEGSWKEDSGNYEITLPDSKPETVQAKLQGDDKMILPRNGLTLVLDRDL